MNKHKTDYKNKIQQWKKLLKRLSTKKYFINRLMMRSVGQHQVCATVYNPVKFQSINLTVSLYRESIYHISAVKYIPIYF